MTQSAGLLTQHHKTAWQELDESICETTPIVAWFAYSFMGYMAGPEAVALWPTSFMLLGLEHSPSVAFSMTIWVACALANVLLYALAAVAVFSTYRYIVKRRSIAGSPRRG